MRNSLRFIAFTLPLFIVFFACDKDKKTVPEPAPDPVVVTPTPVTTGNMKIVFSNEVDGVGLEFGKSYTNAKGESYTVSKFNYYVSNLVLTKTDNSQVTISNTYHLVKHPDNQSKTFVVSGIPSGSYKAATLMLGVDSLRNVSGAQTGALDPANAMFWDWNQGYIFMKLEGTAAAAPGTKFEYHLGGFKGVNKAQRNFSLSFGTEVANVSNSATPTLALSVNVNEVFKDPTLLSIADYPAIMSPGTVSMKMIADNYADMIKFVKISNP